MSLVCRDPRKKKGSSAPDSAVMLRQGKSPPPPPAAQYPPPPTGWPSWHPCSSEEHVRNVGDDGGGTKHSTKNSNAIFIFKFKSHRLGFMACLSAITDKLLRRDAKKMRSTASFSFLFSIHPRFFFLVFFFARVGIIILHLLLPSRSRLLARTLEFEFSYSFLLLFPCCHLLMHASLLRSREHSRTPELVNDGSIYC